MWYRSIITNKFVRGSSDRLVDSIIGKGTFEGFVKNGLLREVENPSVIDILHENKSSILAAVRYQELHNCSRKEAWEGIKALKKDMSSENQKEEQESCCEDGVCDIPSINPDVKE